MRTLRGSVRPLAQLARSGSWHVRVRRDARVARTRRAQLCVFHDFALPPAGGANQTLRALLGEIERRGVTIEHGAASGSAEAVLVNSFNFDARRFDWFAQRLSQSCRIVHRVGAVTTLYRGYDDGTDARVADTNRRYADATIAISHATIDMYRSIGIELVAPQVIYNPVDPSIFHARGRVRFDRSRKTRLIAVSWSDNPRKGGPVYRWLESVLDRNRYELTFVGNTSEVFKRATVIPPVSSRELAELLRTHDVFVTATQYDAYSNALVEALSCGLPAVYLDSGGSGEAVRDAGFAFTDREQIPALLDRLCDEYEACQAAIDLPEIADLVDQYLLALGLEGYVTAGTVSRGR